jgi:hypothetical protein
MEQQALHQNPVSMPTILLSLITGRCFILLRRIILAAFSTVASSSIVIRELEATIPAVIAFTGKSNFQPLTIVSLVVRVPTGLSFWTKINELISYLFKNSDYFAWYLHVNSKIFSNNIAYKNVACHKNSPKNPSLQEVFVFYQRIVFWFLAS